MNQKTSFIGFLMMYPACWPLEVPINSFGLQVYSLIFPTVCQSYHYCSDGVEFYQDGPSEEMHDFSSFRSRKIFIWFSFATNPNVFSVD